MVQFAFNTPQATPNPIVQPRHMMKRSARTTIVTVHPIQQSSEKFFSLHIVVLK
jgi:hypothetical protein